MLDTPVELRCKRPLIFSFDPLVLDRSLTFAAVTALGRQWR